MRKLSLPPRIKVLEAAGSLADGRVSVVRDSGEVVEARVSSSMGDRVYRVVVKVSRDGSLQAYSDDNGTKFRGYIGYPIIAVLMLKELLPRSLEVERALYRVPWRELNERLRSYDRVLEEVSRIAEARGVSRAQLEEFMERVLEKIRELRVYSIA
ncbi:MAG: hypothetical protein QXS85_00555 [Acidilobaceae archaeon]